METTACSHVAVPSSALGPSTLSTEAEAHTPAEASPHHAVAHGGGSARAGRDRTSVVHFARATSLFADHDRPPAAVDDPLHGEPSYTPYADDGEGGDDEAAGNDDKGDDKSTTRTAPHETPFSFVRDGVASLGSPFSPARQQNAAVADAADAVTSPPALRTSTVFAVRASFSTHYLPPGPADVLLEDVNGAGEAYHWMPAVRNQVNVFSPRRRLTRTGSVGSAHVSAHAPPPLQSSPPSSPSCRSSRARQSAAMAQSDLDAVTAESVTFKKAVRTGGIAAAVFKSVSGTQNRRHRTTHDTSRVSVPANITGPRRRDSRGGGPPVAELPASPSVLSLSTADLDAVRLSFFAHTKRWTRQELVERQKRLIAQLLRDEVEASAEAAARRPRELSAAANVLHAVQPNTATATSPAATTTTAATVIAEQEAVEAFIANSSYLSGSDTVPVDIPARYVQAARLLLIAEYEVAVKTEMDNLQRRRFQQFEEEWKVTKQHQRSRERAAAATAALVAKAMNASSKSGTGTAEVKASGSEELDNAVTPIYPATCPMTLYCLPEALSRHRPDRPRPRRARLTTHAQVAGDLSTHASPTARPSTHSSSASPLTPTAPPPAYTGTPSVDALIHLATAGQPLFARQYAWDVDLFDDVSLTLRNLEREHLERMSNKPRPASATAAGASSPMTAAMAHTGGEAELTEEDAFFSKPATFASHTTPLSYLELDNLDVPLPTFVYVISRLLFQQCYANTCFPPGLFARVLVDPFFFPDEEQCYPSHYVRYVPIQAEEAISRRLEHLRRVNRRVDVEEEVAVVADDFLSVFYLLQPVMRRANTHSLVPDAPAPWLGLAPEEEDALLDADRPTGFPPLTNLSKRHRHALREHLYELGQAAGVRSAVEDLLAACRRVAQEFFESIDTEQRGFVRWSAFTDALVEHAEVTHQRRRALEALRLAQTSASVFDRYMVEPMPRQLSRLGYTGTVKAVKHSGALVILEGPYDYAVCNSAALMSIHLKLMVRSANTVYEDMNTIAMEAARTERYKAAAAAAGASGRTVPTPPEAARVVSGYSTALAKRPWRVNQRPPAGVYLRYEDGRRLQDETAMSTLSRLQSRKRAAIEKAGGNDGSRHPSRAEPGSGDDDDEEEEDGPRQEGAPTPSAAQKAQGKRTELLEAVALRHVLANVPMTMWTTHADLMLRVYTTHHFIQAVPEAGLFQFAETVTSMDWVGGGVPAPVDVDGATSHLEAQRRRQQAQRRQDEAAATAASALDRRKDSAPSQGSQPLSAAGEASHTSTSSSASAVVTAEDERQYAALRELLIVGTRTGEVLLVNAKQMLLRIPRIAAESNPTTGVPSFIGNAHDASAGYADLAAKTYRDDVTPYIAARQRLHEGIVSSISVLNSASQPPGVLVTASMDGTVCIARVHATVTPESAAAWRRFGRHRRSDEVGHQEDDVAAAVRAGAARLVALRTFSSGEAGVRQVVHAPTAQMLVILSAAHRVFLCGTTNQRVRVELYDPAAPHYAPIVAVVVEEAINQILSVDESGFVKVWNLSNCMPLTSFQATEGYDVNEPGDLRLLTSRDTAESGSAVLNSGGTGKNARVLADTPDLALTTRKAVERAAENHRGRPFARVNAVAYDHVTKRLLVTGYHNAAMGTFVSGQGGITAHYDSVRFMAVCKRLTWLVSLSQTDARGWHLETGSMGLGIRVHNPEYQLLAEERVSRTGGGGGILAVASLEDGADLSSGATTQDRQVRSALEKLLHEEQRGTLDRVKRPPPTMHQVLRSVSGVRPAPQHHASAGTTSRTTGGAVNGAARHDSGGGGRGSLEPHQPQPSQATVTCACVGVRDRFIFYGLSSGDIRVHRSDSGRLTKTFITTPPTVDDVLRATLRYRHIFQTATSSTAAAKANTVSAEDAELALLDCNFLTMSRAAVHAGTSMMQRTGTGRDSGGGGRVAGDGGAGTLTLPTTFTAMTFPQRAEAVAMLLFRLLTETARMTPTAPAAVDGKPRDGVSGDRASVEDDPAASFHASPVALLCLEGSQELLVVYTDGLLRYFPLAGTSSCALRLVIPPYLVSKAVYYLRGGPSLRAQSRLDVAARGRPAGAHARSSNGGLHRFGSVASALPPLAPTTTAAPPASTPSSALVLDAVGVAEADAVSIVAMSPQLQLACVVHMNGAVTILDISTGISAGAGSATDTTASTLRGAGLGVGSTESRANVVHSFSAPTDEEVTAACFLGAYPALVLADRRGRLHFYVVRGAPLLAMWETVLQLATHDRASLDDGEWPQTAASASSTGPGAPLVWSLPMPRDMGTPSAMCFDALHTTLYVGTRDGYLASFLVRKLLIALDLRPLNVSDTDVNLSVYWTALKHQQERHNEEAIRNILLVLFNVTPDAVCRDIARRQDTRLAESTTGPASPSRASTRRTSGNSSLPQRPSSGRRPSSGPTSGLPNGGAPRRSVTNPATVADTWGNASSTTTATTRAQRHSLAAPTADQPVLWQNSLSWVYTVCKPLLTRASLYTAHDAPLQPRHGTTGHHAARHGDETQQTASETGTQSRPRHHGHVGGGRAVSPARRASLMATSTFSIAAANASGASRRGSILCDSTSSGVAPPQSAAALTSSLPVLSLADATLSDVLLASTVLNDAIHLLRLRYEMESGTRGGGGGDELSSDGLTASDELKLIFLTTRTAEREREKAGNVASPPPPPPLGASVHGERTDGGDRGSFASSRPIHGEDEAGAMRLEKDDIGVIRGWIVEALTAQRALVTGRPGNTRAEGPDALTSSKPPHRADSAPGRRATFSPTNDSTTTTSHPTLGDTTTPGGETADRLVDVLRLEILTGRTTSAMTNSGALQLLYASASSPAPMPSLAMATANTTTTTTPEARRDGMTDSKDGIGAAEFSVFNDRQQHPITARWLEPLFARHALFMSANSPLALLSPAATLERARMEHRERDLSRLARHQHRMRHPQEAGPKARPYGGSADEDNTRPDGHANDDEDEADDKDAADGVLQQQLRQDEFIEGTIPKLVMEVFRRPGRVLKEVSRLSNADLSITSLCTRPNGLLYVGCGDGSISLWTPYGGARLEQVCPSTSLTRSILTLAQSVKSQFRFMREALRAQQQREAYGADSNGAGSMKTRIKAMLIQHYADQRRLNDETATPVVAAEGEEETSSARVEAKDKAEAASPVGVEAAAGIATTVPAALRKLVDVRGALQLMLGYLSDKDVHERGILLEDLPFLPLRMARVAEQEAVEEEVYEAAVDAAAARLLHLVCGAESGHTAYVQYYKRATGYVPTAVSASTSASSLTARRRHPHEVMPDLYTMAEMLDPAILRQQRRHDADPGSPHSPPSRRSPHADATAASMNERPLLIAFSAHLAAADTLDADYANIAHELAVADVREEETREYLEMREVMRVLESQARERLHACVPQPVPLGATSAPRNAAGAQRGKHPAPSHTPAQAAVPPPPHTHATTTSAEAAEQATLVRALSIRQRVGVAATAPLRTDMRYSWVSSTEEASSSLLHRVSGAGVPLSSAANDAAPAVGHPPHHLSNSSVASGTPLSASSPHLPHKWLALESAPSAEDPFDKLAPFGVAATPRRASLAQTSSPHARGAALRRSLLSHSDAVVSGLLSLDFGDAVVASRTSLTSEITPGLHEATQQDEGASSPGARRRSSGSVPRGPVERLAMEAMRYHDGVTMSTTATPLPASPAKQLLPTSLPLPTPAAATRASVFSGVGEDAPTVTGTDATTAAAAPTAHIPARPEEGGDSGGGDDDHPEEDLAARARDAQRAEAWLYSSTYTLSQPLLVVNDGASGSSTPRQLDGSFTSPDSQKVALRLALDAASLTSSPIRAAHTPLPAPADASALFFLTEAADSRLVADTSLARPRSTNPSGKPPTPQRGPHKAPVRGTTAPLVGSHDSAVRDAIATPLHRPPRSPSPVTAAPASHACQVTTADATVAQVRARPVQVALFSPDASPSLEPHGDETALGRQPLAVAAQPLLASHAGGTGGGDSDRFAAPVGLGLVGGARGPAPRLSQTGVVPSSWRHPTLPRRPLSAAVSSRGSRPESRNALSASATGAFPPAGLTRSTEGPSSEPWRPQVGQATGGVMRSAPGRPPRSRKALNGHTVPSATAASPSAKKRIHDLFPSV